MIALVSRQRDASQVTAVDSSAFIQIIFAVIGFSVSIRELLRNRTLRIIITKSPLKWLFLFIILGLFSSLWSVDFKVTLYRAFENLSFLLLICSALAIIYKRSRSPEILINWILYYAALLIITGTLKRSLLWGLSFFSFETFFLEQMNSAPYFFLVLLLPVGWLIKGLILPISIFSLSNTAYIGMTLGSAGLNKGKKKYKIIFIIVTLLIAFLIYYFGLNLILENTIFYGKGGVGLEYTTGRDLIFEYSMKEGSKSPWLGYGFVAGEIDILNNTLGVMGAHNGFMSAFLGMGMLGLITFMIFFKNMFLISRSKFLPAKYRAVFMATIILISVYTTGNPGLGTRVYGSWISSTLIMVVISIVYLHFKSIRKI